MRAGQHLLRPGRPDLLCSGCCPDVLRSGPKLLRQQLGLQQRLPVELLQAQVLQTQVLQAPLLPNELLPLELR